MRDLVFEIESTQDEPPAPKLKVELPPPEEPDDRLARMLDAVKRGDREGFHRAFVGSGRSSTSSAPNRPGRR